MARRDAIDAMAKVLSGSDRRALSYGSEVGGTKRPASEAGRTRRKLAVVKFVPVSAGGWEDI